MKEYTAIAVWRRIVGARFSITASVLTAQLFCLLITACAAFEFVPPNKNTTIITDLTKTDTAQTTQGNNINGNAKIQPLPAKGDGSKPVYGADNRIELIYADAAWCHAGASIAAVFTKSQLTYEPNDTWSVKDLRQLGDDGWCPGQRFSSQPTGARCTATLIAPDRMVTAAHCISSPSDQHSALPSCGNTVFVFDYKSNANGFVTTRFNNNQIYFCKEVLDNNRFADADWRVLKLDRSANRAPLRLLRELPDDFQQLQLTAIGHPLGLPIKATINGQLRNAESDHFFLANIDAFEGNSGSPVMIKINSHTAVVGMIASGESDYILDEQAQCKIARACNELDCRGEQVLSASLFSDYASNTSVPEQLNSMAAKGLPVCY